MLVVPNAYMCIYGLEIQLHHILVEEVYIERRFIRLIHPIYTSVPLLHALPFSVKKADCVI